MDWFVDPETVRIPLGDDYIDVKGRLTHGEQEDFNELVATYDEAGRARLNLRMLRTARVLTYLVGWSLVKQGQPVPMSPDLPKAQRIEIIDSLGVEAFERIHMAILTHEAGLERADPKNGSGV